MDKNTVHITYNEHGVPVNSFVDGDAEKSGFPQYQLSKPSTSIHTPEWDKCVADVKAKGGADDPYAVCTAQLGESSFKSEHRGLAYIKSLIVKAQKQIGKFGIGNAGPVPSSLLARQDLEDEACESEYETGDGIALNAKKGVADNEKLVDLKEDSKDVKTKEQKDELIGRIKQTQEKRQNATLRDRGAKKSFKEFWTSFNNKSEYDIARPGENNKENLESEEIVEEHG